MRDQSGLPDSLPSRWQKPLRRQRIFLPQTFRLYIDCHLSESILLFYFSYISSVRRSFSEGDAFNYCHSHASGKSYPFNRQPAAFYFQYVLGDCCRLVYIENHERTYISFFYFSVSVRRKLIEKIPGIS